MKRFKWTSITESEFERLVERCNFTPVELQILELRRKGTSPVAIRILRVYAVKSAGILATGKKCGRTVH
jgi:hypothetical protein